MQDSIFTKIINGEIPCNKIYEDEDVIAFLDIHPVQPGHVLVVPKMQVDHFEDLPEDTYLKLWLCVKKISHHLKKLGRNRIGIIVDGTGVPHTHVHLIPFDKTAELINLADMDAEPDYNALKEMASKLEIKGEN
jgi:histidine triad (HIT) family protein